MIAPPALALLGLQVFLLRLWSLVSNVVGTSSSYIALQSGYSYHNVSTSYHGLDTLQCLLDESCCHSMDTAFFFDAAGLSNLVNVVGLGSLVGAADLTGLVVGADLRNLDDAAGRSGLVGIAVDLDSFFVDDAGMEDKFSSSSPLQTTDLSNHDASCGWTILRLLLMSSSVQCFGLEFSLARLSSPSRRVWPT